MANPRCRHVRRGLVNPDRTAAAKRKAYLACLAKSARRRSKLDCGQ